MLSFLTQVFQFVPLLVQLQFYKHSSMLYLPSFLDYQKKQRKPKLKLCSRVIATDPFLDVYIDMKNIKINQSIQMCLYLQTKQFPLKHTTL